jgi:hypothetical protein
MAASGTRITDAAFRAVFEDMRAEISNEQAVRRFTS